jgi:plasmid stabilization system protein ParE
MARVTWSPRAAADFADTCEFLGKRSETYAASFANGVRAVVESRPRLGAMVPDYELDEIRERLHLNYRIIYRIAGEDIEIVAFVNASRRLPRTPPG